MQKIISRFYSSCSPSTDLLISLDKSTGIQTLKLNRPKRLNAINSKLYAAIPAALTQSCDDPEVKITLITGTGRYFSSGNDLPDFAARWMEAKTPKAAAEMSGTILRNFVASFIEYPKVMVAAINGPAVGIAATILPLFDAVFMSDQATLWTPFASTAQAPEGCSSYTFPNLMGKAKANQMLLFDQTLTAEQAKEVGLVSHVFPHENFEEIVQEKLSEMSQFDTNALERIKKINNVHDNDFLHLVNERECQHLIQVWQSPECTKAIQALTAKLQQAKSS